MTHDRWTWTTPWIDVGIAGLLAVTIFGAAFLGSRAGKLHFALEEAARAGEPLSETCMDAARTLLTGNGFNIGLVLGVIYLMVAKPPTLVTCIAAVVVGGIAGLGAFTLALGSSSRVVAPERTPAIKTLVAPYQHENH